MAKMEIKGKEAIKAPKTSFFFAISLAPTINPPERRTPECKLYPCHTTRLNGGLVVVVAKLGF